MTLVSSPSPTDRPNTGNQQAEKERLEMLWIERDVGDLQALGEDGSLERRWIIPSRAQRDFSAQCSPETHHSEVE